MVRLSLGFVYVRFMKNGEVTCDKSVYLPVKQCSLARILAAEPPPPPAFLSAAVSLTGNMQQIFLGGYHAVWLFTTCMIDMIQGAENKLAVWESWAGDGRAFVQLWFVRMRRSGTPSFHPFIAFHGLS